MSKVNSIESIQLETAKQWLESEVAAMMKEVSNPIYQSLLESSLRKVTNNYTGDKKGVFVRKFIKEVSFGYRKLMSSHNTETQKLIEALEVSDTSTPKDEIATIMLADLVRILSQRSASVLESTSTTTQYNLGKIRNSYHQDYSAEARARRIAARKLAAEAIKG